MSSARSSSVAPNEPRELRLPAIRLQQGADRFLYVFGVDGKELPSFATISRVHRDDDRQMQGYQRPEVQNHIAEIRRYIESPGAMIPNALVVAFDERVRFEAASDDAETVGYARSGTLIIPINEDLAEEEKPGWIVDGQQRTAAIREARVASFPVSVVGFIARDAAEQRAQFILVNATKPLSKSLIYELLPATDGSLPLHLLKKQLPSRVLERLNFDIDSPLAGLIQTPTTPGGVIKDNSILKALDSSISDGALYRYRDPATGDGDIDSMLVVVKAFWTAVELLFPSAWGLPARKSRLMHGAGVVSLSFLMDAIAEPFLVTETPDSEVLVDYFVRGLQVVAPLCHWTDGEWDFGEGIRRRWNDIQNVPRDVQALTSYLQYSYRQRA